MLTIYLLLLGMIFLWGASFVVVDIAVEYIPPLSVALYRFVIASAAFLILDIIIKLSKKKNGHQDQIGIKDSKFSKNEWLIIFLASITGVSVFFLCQYTAIQLIGPSLPALFVCLLAPVIISVLALIFFYEKLTKLKIIGFIIATIGGFLLVTGGDIRNLTPEHPNFIGYLLALITPLLWAIYSTLTKKVSKNNLKMLKYIAYFGTLELFVFVILNNELIIFISNFLNVYLLLCALYLGLGCYIIGYLIWQHSQKELKSSKVASFLYVEPFLTLLLSILFQRSETIVLWNILGGLIVLVAVLIINYK